MRCRPAGSGRDRINSDRLARRWVVIACSRIVEAALRVELLAGKLKGVGEGAGGRREVAVGVVRLGVVACFGGSHRGAAPGPRIPGPPGGLSQAEPGDLETPRRRLVSRHHLDLTWVGRVILRS